MGLDLLRSHYGLTLADDIALLRKSEADLNEEEREKFRTFEIARYGKRNKLERKGLDMVYRIERFAKNLVFRSGGLLLSGVDCKQPPATPLTSWLPELEEQVRQRAFNLAPDVVVWSTGTSTFFVLKHLLRVYTSLR